MPMLRDMRSGGSNVLTGQGAYGGALEQQVRRQELPGCAAAYLLLRLLPPSQAALFLI